MNITEKAMIVRLHRSAWGEATVDREAEGVVAREFEAQREMHNIRKALLPKGASASIHEVLRAARKFHLDNTMPWDDFGGRILPADNYFDYNKRMIELKAALSNAVNEFVSKFETAKEQARKQLGKSFKERDYPSGAEIRSKYGMEIGIEPIPHATDFRVTLSEGEAERIKAEIESSVTAKVDEAMKDLYKRLYEVVAKLRERASDSDAVFRDSVIKNVAGLVELLPRLNLNGNGELEKLRKEVEQKLCSYDPDSIRKDETVRARAAADADAILQKMAGYVGK